MKILLDENLPVDLRHEIHGHDCETVTFRGWTGISNGKLLDLALAAGFEALLTNDNNLHYQQDTSNLAVAVVMLGAPTNKLEDIRPITQSY